MKPVGFVEFKRARYAALLAEYEISRDEIAEAYPDAALIQEWERLLSDCAARRLPFSRQLLQSLSVHMQHGINRLSKGASLPAGYVIPPSSKPTKHCESAEYPLQTDSAI